MPERSGAGIAGGILALIAFVISLIGFLIVVSAVSNPYDYSALSKANTGSTMFIIGAIFALPALICSIVGCAMKVQKKGFAILGLVLSILVIVFFLIILFLGMGAISTASAYASYY